MNTELTDLVEQLRQYEDDDEIINTLEAWLSNYIGDDEDEEDDDEYE